MLEGESRLSEPSTDSSSSLVLASDSLFESSALTTFSSTCVATFCSTISSHDSTTYKYKRLIIQIEIAKKRWEQVCLLPAHGPAQPAKNRSARPPMVNRTRQGQQRNFVPISSVTRWEMGSYPSCQRKIGSFFSLKGWILWYISSKFKIFRACGVYRHRRANISILIVIFSNNSYKFYQKP